MVLIQGLKNHNEFYTDLYLSEVLEQDLRGVLNDWREEKESSGEQTPWEKFRSLRSRYFELLTDLDKGSTERNADASIQLQRDFIADMVRILGYEYTPETYMLTDDTCLPCIYRGRDASGRYNLAVIEVLQEKENSGDEDLLEYRLLKNQYDQESTEDIMLLSDPVDVLVTKKLFGEEEPPRWVIVIGISGIILIDRSKWAEKRMLEFDLREIFDARADDLFKATAVLLHHDSLIPFEGNPLLDSLDENSHKHAYDVSEDLKYAVRECVELLGNEVLQSCRKKGKGIPDADTLSLESLRWMYRLLFLFYIEARPELHYIPLDNPLYMKGYSLESLREIVEGPELDMDREGSYLQESLNKLFSFVQNGIQEEFTQKKKRESSDEEGEVVQSLFSLDALQSHLFDPDRTPWIAGAELRNSVLFSIIRRLSISKPKKGRRRGRISYAHLGINQLGSVYEGLLSYRGFYAEETLYEVHKKGEKFDSLNQAFFITENELDQYDEDEKRYNDDGSFVTYPPGTFIYRLAGRDREKSASYYTPHVLTQSLVKYTLKELLKDIETDEILNLTICEPAMGSAAFINEAIDQLSEVYLSRKQKELQDVISQDAYLEEKQKVKMYIADHNVYGIDLNPIAVELAEVSLWLNTIHRGAYVPWFGLQLRSGNSLIGARRQYYTYSQVLKKSKSAYLNSVPKRIDWNKNLPPNRIYHFLLPDSGMANYRSKEIKEIEPDTIKQIDEWRKEFITGLEEAEADRLIIITRAADTLWKQWTEKLHGLRRELTDEIPIYGRRSGEHHVDLHFKDNAYRKEVSSSGKRSSSEYQRLKFAMDYWCALWFWPITKAELLPERKQFIHDMEEILVGRRGDSLADSTGQLNLLETIDDPEQGSLFTDTGEVNLDELERNRPHLQVVHELAEEQRFLHWELEFADIFQDRGGFDLILGNPPWLKVEWEESGVLSDYDPKFVIKKYTAKQAADLRHEILKNPQARNAYLQEYSSSVGTKIFLNAKQNYPELIGVQTNLYKCFLPTAWRIGSDRGYSGFLHPEGVYDDPKGKRLRREMYPRLRYHFQFDNELKLFSEVDHHQKFSINIYSRNKKDSIEFDLIANLYAPSTIGSSYSYSGVSAVTGIKIDGKWNTLGHRDRIIRITEKELRLFAELYDSEGTGPLEARLPSLHAVELVSVLEKFSSQPKKLGDLKGEYFALEMWHETNAQKDNIIKRDTQFPEDPEHWVLSGPHFFVGNPFNKTPRANCKLNSDYDPIDLTYIPEEYLPRTNYVPVGDITPDGCEDLCTYRAKIPRVPWKNPGEAQGRPVTEFYRFVNRRLAGASAERTLIPSIIFKKAANIDAVFSLIFKKNKHLINFFGTACSLIYDFFVKSTGITNIRAASVKYLPFIPINEKITCRSLLLVSVSSEFDELYSNLFTSHYKRLSWTKSNPRLDNRKFSSLTPEWNWDTPLRTDYERRQALVEIDVLTAQAMGLTLNELQTIYRIQFPVMQQYEKETFYDQKGRIVFTINKGLSGVGFPRKKNPKKEEPIGWEDICDMQSGTVTRTITDDTLPGGPKQREITYYAPFDRCDRETDYEIAWKEFERREKENEG